MSDERISLIDLPAVIAQMRALGILEWNGIKLGPPPAPSRPEETREEMEARLTKARARERDTMFAASSVRPLVPGEKR